MVNMIMSLYSQGRYYNQANSIGLSGSAVISNRSENKVTNIKGANPPKFYPSNQGYSNYANLRRIYRVDGGGGENYFRSSQVTQLKKITAIGKSNFSNNENGFSHGYIDKSFVKSSLQRVRNAGSVAPKKKTSIDNKNFSRGTSITNVPRSLNRVVKA